MGKLVIFTVLAAAAITAAAVPAALLTGNAEEEETLQTPDIEPRTKPKRKFRIPSLTTKYIPQLSSASSIKNRYKEIGCLKSYFGEIQFGTSNTSAPTSNDIQEFDANSQSCLLVEYYKQGYTDGKWWGGFRIIWAVKNDSQKQGFITVTSSRTYEGKLWGNSAAYTLKKGDSGNSWSTLNIKEIGLGNKNAQGLKNLIPTANSSLPGLSKSTDHWGLKPNLNEICKDDVCEETNGQMIHSSYSWEFTQGSNGSVVHSWATNISYWFKQIFGWNGFEKKVSKVKGQWQTKESWPK